MMMESNSGYTSNPFGAAPAQTSANPFGGAPPTPDPDPWAAGSSMPPSVAPDSGSLAVAVSVAGGYPAYPTSPSDASLYQNPFGAAPLPIQQHQQQHQAHQASPYGFPPTDQVNGHSAPPYGLPVPSTQGTNGHGMMTQTNHMPVLQHDQNPYGLYPSQNQQPQPMYEPQQHPSQPPSNPFDAVTNHSSLVVASTQSNPYAMTYGYASQQLATVPQQSNPWGMPTEGTGYPVAVTPTNTGSYDPFTLAPPPPSFNAVVSQEPVNQEADAWFQSPPVAAPNHGMESYQPPVDIVNSDPPGIPANGKPQDPPQRISNQSVDRDRDRERSIASEQKELPDSTASPKGTTYPPQLEYGQRPSNGADPDSPHNMSPRNPYASTLAKEAPPGASPLPKAELVKKTGFVLGRISFRTIVMKKWKQTFWVQYGPHTMLWFRSQADFDDWLNNPYHLQTERNFLIKLAVNFVHDLYKPNVRGYQVTQCRTKGYGNKVVRQFKLERWMDYGPTIAAAFGSYNPAEVDALREAVVECMRNTPLNGGIRATGAVRQQNAMPQRGDGDEEDDGYREQDGGRRASYDDLPLDNKETERNEPKSESVAEEADLLDVNNWDDVPLEPQALQPTSSHQMALLNGGPQQPTPHANTGSYGLSDPHDSQQLYQQPVYNQPPQQAYAPPHPSPQADYSTALVPAGAHLSQPWAPQQQQPPPTYQYQQQGYAPPQQQQQHQQQQQAYQFQQQVHPPSHQPTDPWSTPQPNHQTQPYLAPPEY